VAAYAQSKLANLLFAFELDRRLKSAGGSRVISVAAHPGYSATNLQFSGPPPLERIFMRLSNRLVAQSAEMGALPLLYAATARDLPGGSYVGRMGRQRSEGTLCSSRRQSVPVTKTRRGASGKSRST
jgi:NAD(P)-dependent dehydrogenase (short-subunit alcohol dehydrogenase family)